MIAIKVSCFLFKLFLLLFWG